MYLSPSVDTTTDGYKMTSMLRSGLKIGPILTQHFPVADLQKGFDIMRSGQSGKIVLDWTA